MKQLKVALPEGASPMSIPVKQAFGQGGSWGFNRFRPVKCNNSCKVTEKELKCKTNEINLIAIRRQQKESSWGHYLPFTLPWITFKESLSMATIVSFWGMVLGWVCATLPKISITFCHHALPAWSR